MTEPQIQPHRITKPMQLLAVWMAGLVLLVGAFLGGARLLTKPDWLPTFLAISAVALVPLFLVLLFLMQTKFRPELQEDSFYAPYLANKAKEFHDFKAENLPGGKPRPPGEIPNPKLSTGEDLERVRVRRYEKYHGVFLVHTWRPSKEKGQVADVLLRLQQHREGPLSAGLVKRVEYALGPNFFQAPVVKENGSESFRLEVSAYGPMLCVARVQLVDGSCFEVERYVDFDVPTGIQPGRHRPSGFWN